jgi:hypothetical protein
MSVGDIQPLTTCHPLRSTGVTPLPRYYGAIRLLLRLRPLVVAFSSPTACADLKRSPGVRLSNFSPSPPSLPHGHDRISGVVLGGTLALTRRPHKGFTCVRDCDMLPASIPHALTGKTIPVHWSFIVSCSCLQLVVASDRPHRGLSPPFTEPCPAHLHSGSLRSPALREVPPADPPKGTFLLITTWGHF